MMSGTIEVAWRRVVLGIMCAGLSALGAARPANAAQYKFTSLNIAGGTAVASALDDKDRVVGTFTPSNGDSSQGVVWLKSVPSLIPGTKSLNALSDNGLAAGMGSSAKHQYIIYDLNKSKTKTYKDGTAVRIDAPTGINASGTVVALGLQGQGSRTAYYQALYLQGSTGLILKPPGYSFAALVYGINDSGTAIGFYIDCFTYQNGTYTNFLPPDANASGCAGTHITNAGIVYGSYETHNGGYSQHGFILDAGNYTYINYPGADGTVVGGLGPNGEVVGYYLVDNISHAFLLVGGTYYELKVPGASSAQIIGINATGSLLINTATGPYLAQCPAKDTCTK